MKHSCKYFVLFYIFFVAFHTIGKAQIFTTLAGTVSFESDAPLEKISAFNKRVATQIDLGQAKGQFIIPIQQFSFKSALMQEHFNENYLESEKYPRATYKFVFTNFQTISLDKQGVYPVLTSGILTLKDKSKTIEVPGTIEVIDNNTIRVKSSFTIAPEDYGIKVPKLVRKKIAENVQVIVNSILKKN